MSTEDGTLTVVHNGEIYNAAELRGELEQRGHVFRSRCDTEVILRGHREWGDALPAKLDGMFAYAVWDARARQLTVARDRLGIKPLWIARAGERVVFASEVRALLAARALPASLDGAAVASYLAWGAVVEPRAIVRGARALEPGTIAVFRDGDERRARFWKLPDDEVASSPSEAALAVRAALDRAVGGCLEADVPVALLLSGGIDSAALALVAGARRPIRTFHVHLGDEMATRAAEVARSLAFQHEEVRIDARDAAALLPSVLAAQDQPAADGANTFLIARAIHAAGLKAAVSGLGADELFLGYPLHRNYVRARRLADRPRLRAPLQRAAGLLARAPASPFPVEKLIGVAAAGGAATQTHAALRALFPDTQRARLLADAPPPAPPLLDGPSPEAEVSRLELATYVRNTLLRDADVMGMAHGVELRVPILERAVVETVLRLPGALKLRSGAQKPLLVEAVPELSSELTTARKRGFDLPFHDWVGGPLRDAIEESLRSGDRLGLVAHELDRVWRRFLLRRDRASAFRVWSLHALIRWAERHGATR
jgi:asparagine synthase (glutamine-hydrolysing)